MRGHFQGVKMCIHLESEPKCYTMHKRTTYIIYISVSISSPKHMAQTVETTYIIHEEPYLMALMTLTD